MAEAPGAGVGTGRLWRLLPWLATGYCAVLVLAIQWPPGVAPLDFLMGVAQYIPLSLVAALGMRHAAARGAQLHPQTRASLRRIAAGLALCTLGMVSYMWSHAAKETPLGLPVAGDAFYLPGYVLILLGLLRLPSRDQLAYRNWHLLLDAAVALVGVSLVTWYMVIEPTTAQATDWLGLLVRIAYPILGLGFLLALNALVLRGGPIDGGAAFTLLAGGVTLYVIADGGYQLLYYGDAHPAAWLERLDMTAYAFAYLLLVFAANRYGLAARRASDSEPQTMHSMSPLPLLVTGAVAILISTVAFSPWMPGTSSLILGLVLLMFLALLRQWITSRQNAVLQRDRARREGDRRVAALVRHASDVIMLAEPDGRIRFASPSLAALLGLDPEEVAGRPLRSLVVAEDWPAFAVGGEEEPRQRSTITARLRHVDGSTRECEVVANDLAREPGIEGVVYVARDLTERRALESRLQQAQKMEAVGRLAGGIAHDFNNLLTTILAEVELLLEDAGRREGREDLETVHQAALQAAGLTRQLLAFSRRQVPSARTVDLDALVGETLRMFVRSAGQVTVRRTTPPVLSQAWVDPHQISQMLLNLLLNARDAMPTGGTIVIALEEVTLTGPWLPAVLPASAGRYVMLQVSDTGIGMDQATRDRVFEPFFTTKATGRGTGLGLPTVLSTVETHRGGLRIESAPDAGTRVTVLLPVSTAPATGAVVELAEGGEEGVEPRGRERILLVDDEEPVRDVTRRVLERLGYDVETAAGGEQARRAIAVGGCPDLLITDVIMPEESGPRLAEALQAGCPGLPVLFISGYTGDELQQQGALRIGTTLLQKPYTSRELAERVRTVLDMAGSASRVGTGENRPIVRS